MINKYWNLEYAFLIGRVRAWSALEGGYYDNKSLRRYKDYKWHDLSEALINAEIGKAFTGFKTYFYCPDCGRKMLIKDAVVKRTLMDSSMKIGNAAMPGWMKIETSGNSCYMRFCGECVKKKDNLRDKTCLIGGLALPLLIAFINSRYFFQTFLTFAISGFALSMLVYKWIEKKKHPNEFARAYDGNALATKSEV